MGNMCFGKEASRDNYTLRESLNVNNNEQQYNPTGAITKPPPPQISNKAVFGAGIDFKRLFDFNPSSILTSNRCLRLYVYIHITF